MPDFLVQRRSLPALATLFMVFPAAAPAATMPELRVEPGGAPLSGAVHYATGTVSFRADRHPACRGSGGVRRVAGPTALGILYDAQVIRHALRPVRTTDRFSVGDFLCGIGSMLTSTDRYWDVRVNNLTPPVGASEVRLRSADRVLWFYVDTATGSNTGKALELLAPARARPGETITVTVLAHDGEGDVTPAMGARVGESITDAHGRAVVPISDSRRVVLRATRLTDIASAPVAVCVSQLRERCPARRGWTIVGRRRGERLRGTRGADVISARGGNDVVIAHGGESDRIRCGAGRDTAIVSSNDRVARDCERVR